jgi:hypothetical protein
MHVHAYLQCVNLCHRHTYIHIHTHTYTSLICIYVHIHIHIHTYLQSGNLCYTTENIAGKARQSSVLAYVPDVCMYVCMDVWMYEERLDRAAFWLMFLMYVCMYVCMYV